MIEKVRILVVGGNGGNGAVNFRREKFVPRGGPDGGDGGHGGSVILEADEKVGSLASLAHQRRYPAESGVVGGPGNKHGRQGADVVIKVPAGTVVRLQNERESEGILADMIQPGQRVVVGRGGRGGFGNAHFATPERQAPRFALRGERGETKELLLELKLLADAAVIGLPNVGKSSLLAAVSRAHPKVADYAFTTLEPVLGVVDVGYRSFVLADIPGLVEGAHLGKGLGHEFLRHVERTRVLLHLLDGTTADPVGDWRRINQELRLYQPQLAEKPQLVAVNKVDLPEVRQRQEKILGALSAEGLEPAFVSAASGEGLPELMRRLAALLDAEIERTRQAQPEAEVVLRPEPVGTPEVEPAGEGRYRVRYRPAERLAAVVDLGNEEAVAFLRQRLGELGIARALRRAGGHVGDTLLLGDVELVWE